MEHGIVLAMDGNAHVRVTCKCIHRAMLGLKRQRGAVRRSIKEFGSLGSFPVGSPVADLLAVYNEHVYEAEH